jgi:hypothetical protein
VGVDVVHLAEDNTESVAVAERNGPAGVEEQGTLTLGFSRNLGGPVASVSESGLGIPVNNSRPAAVALCGCGNETQGAAAVPRSEGNGAAREGQQEGGVLRSTEEVGEPSRGCAKKVRQHRAVPEMKVGPSEPSCRGRLQTAISCFGQKPRW